MVTTLQALIIAKPLLPPKMQNLKLDLFHPDYKQSPRMWSPEMHSPFPTIGLSMQSQPSSTLAWTEEKMGKLDEDGADADEELDATRTRLNALFASFDADDKFSSRAMDHEVNVEDVLQRCKGWLESKDNSIKATNEVEWVVETHTEPFQLYVRLWGAIRDLQAKSTSKQAHSLLLVVPNLDSHTTLRLAVTVNAALRRLDIPVRIANVFHRNQPTNSSSRQAPYAMIELATGY